MDCNIWYIVIILVIVILILWLISKNNKIEMFGNVSNNNNIRNNQSLHQQATKLIVNHMFYDRLLLLANLDSNNDQIQKTQELLYDNVKDISKLMNILSSRIIGCF